MDLELLGLNERADLHCPQFVEKQERKTQDEFIRSNNDLSPTDRGDRK